MPCALLSDRQPPRAGEQDPRGFVRRKPRSPQPNLTLNRDGAGSLFTHQGQLRSILQRACSPALVLDSLITLTRSHSRQGDTQTTIVVADDTKFVEHRGNAGRPHAAANHPSRTPGQRRTASLRCKTTTSTDTDPNTTNPNPHAPKHTSTRTPQTGNARRKPAYRVSRMQPIGDTRDDEQAGPGESPKGCLLSRVRACSLLGHSQPRRGLMGTPARRKRLATVDGSSPNCAAMSARE
jgi:hypothetical protein